MLPVMGLDAGRVPKGLKPHLVVKLNEGWEFDATRHVFVSTEGREFSPKTALPKGSKIVYTAPTLATAPRNSLSEAQRNLARYVQVILPKGHDAAAYRPVVAKWECVEEVDLAPVISLP